MQDAADLEALTRRLTGSRDLLVTWKFKTCSLGMSYLDAQDNSSAKRRSEIAMNLAYFLPWTQ